MENMSDKKCPKCSRPVADGVKFCPECGNPMGSPASAAAPQAKKNNNLRDGIVILAVLAIVAAAYFILKEKPVPPLPESQGSGQQSQPSAPAMQGDQQGSPHDMENGMTAAMLDSLPKDYNTLVQMGNNYMDHQNFAIAAECYKRALAMSDESPDVRVDYGACLHGMGLGDRALDEFRKVLAKDPKHPIANFNMGIVFSDKGVNDSVRVYMKKYLSIDPNGAAAGAAKDFLQKVGG
jgi:tetratricopeptide (TPR) repeat protein